jgi:2-polyprenyl-3-methyl-5-hydroxy-6-metoxy-1,4-benzoquinol methylase
MKYAICQTINPRSILEVGVRYGYSAIAFLKAAPDAIYLGIDNDTNSFGGTKGSIRWAKKITGHYKANFLIADTQDMNTFPGDFYDFIHINGQQDGDGTSHDLELALEKGRWILLDGFFWSKENLLSATYFLDKYKNFIEFSLVIPSYAGELLIKTKGTERPIFFRKGCSNSDLKDSYCYDYYMQDCAGYEQFKKYPKSVLEDMRLLTAYYLANPKKGQTILDIGCGRGELAYALAKDGANVTGVDYSDSAISIAQQTFCNQDSNLNLKYIEGDVLSIHFETKFDVIIAADFVEHVEPDILNTIFGKISTLLTPEGILVIHTAPSLLYYQFAYEEKRAMAIQAGSYLPKNPRTYYEDLMHINEQTPESLYNSLSQHFSHIQIWTTTLPDPIGSIGRDFSQDEVFRSRDIFAMASHAPIIKENILHLISQNELNVANLAVTLATPLTDIRCETQEPFKVNVTIKNQGTERLVSRSPKPVHISYHWINEDGHCVIHDGIRTPILKPLQPSEKRDFTMNVIAPEKRGRYRLQISLVQESQFWFEQVVGNLPISITAEVI